MLTLPSSVRIFVACEPMDLRRGFDGLAGAVRNVIREDPHSGHIFAFLNRRRDRAKLLVWERSGFWLLFKRLEKGRFQLPESAATGRSVEMDATDLALMLQGIDLRGAKRRPSWIPA